MRTLHRYLPPPLAGTERAPRGLFVGRWGALLEPPEQRGLRPHAGRKLTPRAGEVLFRATQAGWRLYLVSNEPLVAGGKVSDATFESFQLELAGHLRGLGIVVTRDYACLDHPQGKGNHKRDSVYRFPNTGALYHAVQEDGIDLPGSWLVSADALELAAASRAGARTCALRSDRRVAADSLEVDCERCSPSLAAAVEHLLATDPLRRT